MFFVIEVYSFVFSVFIVALQNAIINMLSLFVPEILSSTPSPWYTPDSDKIVWSHRLFSLRLRTLLIQGQYARQRPDYFRDGANGDVGIESSCLSVHVAPCLFVSHRFRSLHVDRVNRFEGRTHESDNAANANTAPCSLKGKPIADKYRHRRMPLAASAHVTHQGLSEMLPAS